jgi:hypothetical protein
MLEHAKMEPHTAMLIMNKAIAHAYDETNDDDDEPNEGETQWLN